MGSLAVHFIRLLVELGWVGIQSEGDEQMDDVDRSLQVARCWIVRSRVPDAVISTQWFNGSEVRDQGLGDLIGKVVQVDYQASWLTAQRYNHVVAVPRSQWDVDAVIVISITRVPVLRQRHAALGQIDQLIVRQ